MTTDLRPCQRNARLGRAPAADDDWPDHLATLNQSIGLPFVVSGIVDSASGGRAGSGMALSGETLSGMVLVSGIAGSWGGIGAGSVRGLSCGGAAWGVVEEMASGRGGRGVGTAIAFLTGTGRALRIGMGLGFGLGEENAGSAAGA